MLNKEIFVRQKIKAILMIKFREKERETIELECRSPVFHIVEKITMISL